MWELVAAPHFGSLPSNFANFYNVPLTYTAIGCARQSPTVPCTFQNSDYGTISPRFCHHTDKMKIWVDQWKQPSAFVLRVLLLSLMRDRVSYTSRIWIIIDRIARSATEPFVNRYSSRNGHWYCHQVIWWEQSSGHPIGMFIWSLDWDGHLVIGLGRPSGHRIATVIWSLDRDGHLVIGLGRPSGHWIATVIWSLDWDGHLVIG